MKSDVTTPGTIKPPKSKVWHDTYKNALAKGATPEQAQRLAEAVRKGWTRRGGR